MGVVLVAALMLAATVGLVLARRADAAFRERFPPITDTEFVALCSPRTSPEVALKVRRIAADHLAVDYYRIHPSARFIEDLGAD